MKKYLILLLLAVVSVTAGVGCSSDNEPMQITALKLNRQSLMISLGETFQLEAISRPTGAAVKWTSSNESIATVDDKGLVTAVGYGAAVITARYRSYSATCSVTPVNAQPLDPQAALAANMSTSLIYSRDVVMYAPRRIMQGFDLAADGSIYYSQISADGSSVYICHATGPSEQASTEYMTMKYFGHGTQIAVEQTGGRTFIWLNSNGTVDSSGEYGDNWSFSRVEFQAGATYEGYAGETFFLNKDGQYDQQVSLDLESRRLLVGSRKVGVRSFWVFDLDEALALPLKTMTASVKIGSPNNEATVRQIQARDLNDCRVLGNFSFAGGSNQETDVYSYSHQGHEIWRNYIYFYEGNAVAQAAADTFVSVAYVTGFNYTGEIVMPRTKVAAISDVEGLAAVGLTTTGYAEGESLKIRDGKLYLGVACRDGSTSNRRANILVYDCLSGE